MLLFLLANKLACHSFMNADRTKETLRWKIKDGFFTHTNSSSHSISFFVLFPQVPIIAGWHAEDQMTQDMLRVVLQKSNVELRELETFMMGSNHACLLFQKDTFLLYYAYSKHCCTLLQKDTISVFQSTIQIPETTVQNKKQSVSLIKREETLNNYRNYFPIGWSTSVSSYLLDCFETYFRSWNI